MNKQNNIWLCNMVMEAIHDDVHWYFCFCKVVSLWHSIFWSFVLLTLLAVLANKRKFLRQKPISIVSRMVCIHGYRNTLSVVIVMTIESGNMIRCAAWTVYKWWFRKIERLWSVVIVHDSILKYLLSIRSFVQYFLLNRQFKSHSLWVLQTKVSASMWSSSSYRKYFRPDENK